MDEIRGTFKKHTLVISGNTITFDGKNAFDLTQIDGLQWQHVRRHVNGLYQGTDLWLGVRDGKRQQAFRWSTDHREDGLAGYLEEWNRLVDRVWEFAGDRLINMFVAEVQAGHEVELGGVGVKVVLGPDGVKKSGPFSKLIPWSQVTGTSVDGGAVKVWWRKDPNDNHKELCEVPAAAFNGRLLPYVIERLMPAPP